MEQWVEEIWEKIQKKMEYSSSAPGSEGFVYTVKDGAFVESDSPDGICWWTNGFWPGILWLMYSQTKNEKYMVLARKLEEKLDECFIQFYKLQHDVGFMWKLSAVADYKITGNAESRRRGLTAATFLAARYNPNGKFICAWPHRSGWAIIDSMMNLSLLYWAYEETEDPRFRQIAQNHADTALEYFIRPDGSVNHIVSFDSSTGDFIETFGGQGFQTGSSWTRGQAWAIYGFIISYLHTGEERYLDAAKRVAHYFIAALSAEDDFVPNCDFRCPDEPLYKDTTAGMIAAAGMIEIAKAVDQYEKKLYLNSAKRIIKETVDKYADWSEDQPSIIQMGMSSYKSGLQIPIIYGDFYFIDAILKLKGNDLMLW